MKEKWQRGGIAPLILILGFRWGYVVSFTPCFVTVGERAPVTHCMGSWGVGGWGWLSHSADLDRLVKRCVAFPLLAI